MNTLRTVGVISACACTLLAAKDGDWFAMMGWFAAAMWGMSSMIDGFLNRSTSK